MELKRILKGSLISIEEFMDKSDNCSISDIWNGIANAMAFLVTIFINIVGFPAVICRFIKGMKKNVKNKR